MSNQTDPESPADEAEDSLHALALSYRDKFPWADVAAIEANLAVFRAANALQRALARFIGPFGYALGPARYVVVRALFMARDGRLSLGEIARRVDVTTTSITNLIDGLEKDGWVTRRANPADRRVTYVELTPFGDERCRLLIPAVARFTAQIFSAFSDEEKKGLTDGLSRLQRLSETARPDAEGLAAQQQAAASTQHPGD